MIARKNSPVGETPPFATEARSKAHGEFDQVLGSCGRSEQEIRDYARARPELRHAMLDLPADGVTGTAARYVRYVASLMSRDPSVPGTAGR